MSTLQTLRRATYLARWVLVWFVLSLGVAVASPLVKPQPFDAVCSASDSQGQTGTQGKTPAVPLHHTLDCVMCLPWTAPPASPVVLASTTALPHTPPATLEVAHRASRFAGPQPARGPPTR